MSVLQELHDAHKARRERLFPARSIPVVQTHAKARKPARVSETAFPAPIYEPELDRLIREAKSLADGTSGLATIWPVNSHDILREVGSFFGIPRSDIVSDRRFARTVYARQISMYLSKRLTRLSLPQIGRTHGGRDYTTVIHAVRKIDAKKDTDRRLADELQIIIMRLAERYALPADAHE